MRYGIAITHDGSPIGNLISWRQLESGIDSVWDSYEEALAANDLDGWRGYVRFYPSGDICGPGLLTTIST